MGVCGQSITGPFCPSFLTTVFTCSSVGSPSAAVHPGHTHLLWCWSSRGCMGYCLWHLPMGCRGISAQSMEHDLFWPWCVLCCFPVFLFPALLPVWCCGWLFLNSISPKVPPFWLKSSAMPCCGFFWSLMEPPVTGLGQPQPFLTKATTLPTHWHWHPVQSYSITIILKVGKEACSFTCTPNPYFCKIRLRKMHKLGFGWLFLGA